MTSVSNFFNKKIPNNETSDEKCETNNSINVSILENMKCIKDIKHPKKQEDYYHENGSPESIINIVKYTNKAFGNKMEEIAREFFNLQKHPSKSHDHLFMFNDKEVIIEQKSSRLGTNTFIWRAQHIELKHNWDILLLCGLGFKGVDFFIATRKQVLFAIDNKFITGQGAKNKKGIAQPQQGYWLKFGRNVKDFDKYFTRIDNYENFIIFLKMNFL